MKNQATLSRAFYKALGTILREERRARGLTQGAVGDYLGVTLQQIQKNERGINRMPVFALIRAAELFKMPVENLMAKAYERSGLPKPDAAEPGPADHDAFLTARHVARIKDSILRRNLVDFTRKLAYEGAQA